MARGSILKRTVPARTRNDGTTTPARTFWRARVPDPRKPAGSGAKVERAFQTKAKAEKWVNDELSKADQGVTAHKPGEQTVAEVMELQRASWQRRQLEPKTVAGYESVWRTHLERQWGKWRIAAITSTDVQAWLDELGEQREAATVLHAYGLMRGLCKRAKRAKIISTNPCTPDDGMELPSLRGGTKPQLYLMPGELRQLHNEIGAHWRTPLLVASLLGLRAGEVWGLRHADVDLENAELTVLVALKDVNGRTICGPTKTHSSRTISLDTTLIDPLRELLEAPPMTRRQGIRRGRPSGYPAVAVGATEIHWTDDPHDPERLLFVTRTGQPVRHNLFYNREFRPAVRKLWPEGHRLHKLRFHDTRHSAASYSLAVTGNLHATMARLGHEDYKTTSSRYGHLLKSVDQATSQGVGAMWAATEPESNVVELRPAEGRA